MSASAVARGVMHLRLGRPQAAVDAFCEALADDPDDAHVHALLALALLDARRLTAARLEAELAVGGGAEDPMALYALGRVRLAERRLEDAERVFRDLIAIEPEDAENHRSLAQALGLRRRPEEAVAALEEALALDPTHAGVLADLADLHREAGRLDEAERLATEALGQDPEHDDALVAMGHVHLRRGRAADARECAVEVLRSRPNHPGATGLLVSVKAAQSPLLGLWWRYATWMVALGDRNILVLLAMYVAYRFGTLLMQDFGPAGWDQLVQLFWLMIVAYTWFAPAIFQRRLEAELAPVTLKKDF